MQWKRIIFQHTPKCAGTSVRQALGAAFGWENVLTDSEDRLEDPASLFQRDRARYFFEARSLTPEFKVISGHFPVRKYAHLPGALRAGILRNPVDRHISHYFFWQTRREFRGNTLLNFVMDKGLDVFQTAELPQMRRYYTDLFFAGAEASDFDLLLFSEALPIGLAELGERIGHPLPHMKLNVTAERDAGIGEAYRRHTLDPGVRAKLLHLLSDDVAFYDRARQWPCAAI